VFAGPLRATDDHSIQLLSRPGGVADPNCARHHPLQFIRATGTRHTSPFLWFLGPLARLPPTARVATRCNEAQRVPRHPIHLELFFVLAGWSGWDLWRASSEHTIRDFHKRSILCARSASRGPLRPPRSSFLCARCASVDPLHAQSNGCPGTWPTPLPLCCARSASRRVSHPTRFPQPPRLRTISRATLPLGPNGP
jgi:hypothetical protein